MLIKDLIISRRYLIQVDEIRDSDGVKPVFKEYTFIEILKTDDIYNSLYIIFKDEFGCILKWDETQLMNANIKEII